MFDYNQQIKQFLKENFNPSVPEEANVKMTSRELLSFIFNTFPVGCISDYDLNDIMNSLNFKRHTYSIEVVSDSKKQNDPKEFELQTGWCLNSFVLKDK